MSLNPLLQVIQLLQGREKMTLFKNVDIVLIPYYRSFNYYGLQVYQQCIVKKCLNPLLQVIQLLQLDLFLSLPTR